MSPLSPYLNLDPKYLVQVRGKAGCVCCVELHFSVCMIIPGHLKPPAVLGTLHPSPELKNSGKKYFFQYCPL